MKKILLTTVAVAALAPSVLAMEAGKMYMRADIGYNMSSPSLNKKLADGKDTGVLFKGTKSSNKLKGFAGDIGFGYALSDSVRTDVTLNLSQGKKTLKDVELLSAVGTGADAVAFNQYSNAAGTEYVASGTVTDAKLLKSTVKLKERKIGLMANAYYDFHNSSEFTPYVMAGVGLNRGTMEANINGYKANTTGALQAASATIKSKNLTSFAYQVGVGVGYEMAKDIVLDAGYKLSGSTGSYKFNKTDTNGIPHTPDGGNIGAGIAKGDKLGSPKIQHTISAGVRFAF